MAKIEKITPEPPPVEYQLTVTQPELDWITACIGCHSVGRANAVGLIEQAAYALYDTLDRHRVKRVLLPSTGR